MSKEGNSGDITSPRRGASASFIAHSYIRQMAFNNIFIFIYWIYIKSTVGYNRLDIIYSFNSNCEGILRPRLPSRHIRQHVLSGRLIVDSMTPQPRIVGPEPLLCNTINLITPNMTLLIYITYGGGDKKGE